MDDYRGMMEVETKIFDTDYELPDYVIGNMILRHPEIVQALRDRKIKISVEYTWDGDKLTDWKWGIKKRLENRI